MYEKYFVTGATGYLGAAVVKRLVRQGASVRALILPGDKLWKSIPPAVETVFGSVDDKASLEPFFRGAEGACVIHCAGIVSIVSKPGEILRRVNVTGTENILFFCHEKKVAKLVYISSVHAIPEKPKGEKISEVERFSPDAVNGDYAKTKAEATKLVLAAAQNGLNASVVHPSGIIGPNDRNGGSITSMILSYCAGKLPVAVKGGYDFVDVRDVADGVIACCERGKAGECYILSNRFISIRELLETLKKLTNGKKILLYLPLKIARLFAPLFEKRDLKRKRKPYFTPYSIETLGTNAVFSHEKATKELGYSPRNFTATLMDMIRWLHRKKVSSGKEAE